MKTSRFFLFFILLPSVTLFGELFVGPFDRFSPWQESDLLIDSYLSFETKRKNSGKLVEMGSYASIFDWKGGLSMAFSSSNKRNLQFDNALLNIQYQILNDSIGDDFSWAVGGALGGVYQKAVKDSTFLHYGKGEARIYTTFGSEVAPYAEWVSRVWGFASFGFAERGVTFGEALVILERRICDRYTIGLFTSMQGNFRRIRGQGAPWRRACDSGLEGTLLLENSLKLSARLFWRSFTKGTPSGPVFCLYADMPWSL